MAFEEIKDTIKKSYRTPDKIVQEFYIPLLSRAKSYDRAVGFFSSSVLIELSRGLINLVNNGGKMRLITSPRLQEQDIQAIKEGYDRRKIVDEAIMREWKEPKNHIEEERLNFLSHLIEDGYLDIKIAFKKPYGLYHEKIGILTDEEGNSVAFTGSLNESEQAINLNFESIDAYTSWDDPDRVSDKRYYFDETWSNLTESLDVIDFSSIAIEKLQTYKKETYKADIDEIEKNIIETTIPNIDAISSDFDILQNETNNNVPKLPFDRLRDYQEKAISEWSKQNYRGIFDMATGTGKTYTGLGAVVDLYNYCKSDLAVIICCPFIHLVEQWVEDLIKYNVEPIVGYGSSTQKNWKTRLERAVECHNRKIEGKKFFCFITTNATFSSAFVQEQIQKLDNKSLLLVDEAHYFGSNKIRKILPAQFDYRLALSATINRHGDEEGTQFLFEYFGDKCIEYTLEMAIEANMLTPYYYYPVLVYLTPEELEKYKLLSKTIAKFLVGGDKKEIPEAAKPYLLKRARLIAGAENKLEALREQILKYKNKNHLLVYCGATTIDAPDNDSANSDEKETIRQIQAVCKMLGNELNMKVAQFTSQEDMKDRTSIKHLFARGDMLQVLVAIKCLDEGFNIPEIQTAFILASTTNPKEYIQRRGRVLRLSEGKEYAEIYDFITLPRPVDDTYSLTEYEQQYEQGLVRREFDRMKEFNKLAINSTDNNENLIWELINSYHLYDEQNFCDIL